jgi:hypothetical protein
LLAAQWPDPIRPRSDLPIGSGVRRVKHLSSVRTVLSLRAMSPQKWVSQLSTCAGAGGTGETASTSADPAIGWWPDRATRICISDPDPPRLIYGDRPAGRRGGVKDKLDGADRSTSYHHRIGLLLVLPLRPRPRPTSVDQSCAVPFAMCSACPSHE